jgi:mannose-6-phosphate isomerase
MHDLALPLTFRPVYQTLVWGGRRMTRWRSDLPEGPIGESWDLADHDRGMSVVAEGPLAGTTLRELTRRHGAALVGDSYAGGDFPLLIKLIDANDRLSVQVHPDDDLARELKVGPRGKTESWFMVADGGELFVGIRPGCTRERFAEALRCGRLAEELNRFPGRDGDSFFIAARTVHALGAGCLLYEIQQTCDVTFRIDDWGRVGLDGKPRPIHVEESLQTIDFTQAIGGPAQAPAVPHQAGGTVRCLARCAYFTAEERKAASTSGGGEGRCSIVVCISGEGSLSTAAGAVKLTPMRTYLIPAAAGAWQAAAANSGTIRLLVSSPV